MKWAVAVISIGVGVLTGELIARLPEASGRLFGRGHLIALVDANGIFEADLKRFVAGLPNASGLFPAECRKLELRDCQFERRLKRNFHCI
jgi:hypothetical protein